MSNQPRTIVIVGGVAGGMSAATRLRRRDERAHIVVLERGPHVSFANCGLPYLIGGAIADRDDVLLQTPQSLGETFGLDVRTNSAVLSIDRDAQRVLVRGEGGDYWLAWDALLLSTGAAAIRPEIPGIERALVLRDVGDMDRIRAALSTARSATVLGAGFIGLEVADNLLDLGIAVTVVHRGEQVMASLDIEMALPIADNLRRRGVDLRLGTTATSIGVDSVELSDGSTVASDVTIVAVGVRPEAWLGVDAGLAIGPSGGILVDDQLRTSDPRIWAVGDVAEKRSRDSDGELRAIPLAGLANRHGRLAADAICGQPIVVAPAFGTAIIKVGSVSAASTGRTESSLSAEGRAVRVIHTHPQSHATYFPGAEPMSMKLIADARTDAILGAQVVGGDGVDKRIDVIATALATGVTASGLADLELAYAPQFGSAKDPVNMVGYVASNRRDGDQAVQWHELDSHLDDGWTLVDVRTREEFAEESIPGALNVPLAELRANIESLRGARVIVHCKVGQRGHTAAALLSQHGIRVANLDGGILTWSAGLTAQRRREPVGR